jgi:arylsulfatase
MTTRKDRDEPKAAIQSKDRAPDRRSILLGGTTLAAASALSAGAPVRMAQAQSAPTPPTGRKPNILVIFGDDIGQTNLSAYSFGLMGYKTPNIDRIARDGMMFTDYYAEQSCTAGRTPYVTAAEPCEPV